MVCYPTYGGSGIVATELGMQLAKSGHEVHFISYAQPQRFDHFQDNLYFHAVEFPHYPLFEFHLYSLALASKIIDVIKYEKLDIIHVHYAIPHAISGFLAKEVVKNEYHTKLITTLHGTDITLVGLEPAFQPLVKYSIDQSDAVTAVSEYLAQKTYEDFDPKKKINVIPNFIDTEFYKKMNLPFLKKQLASCGEKVLVHVSNFRPVKRVTDIIHLVDKIRNEVSVKLLMIGDGPDRSEAEKLVISLGIQDKVKFLGKQQSIVELLSIADLMILPSEQESFGLSALEAMSCGVPVIAYNIGGIPELVRNGYNGYMSDLKDIDGLAESALKILKDEALYSYLSTNARRTAVEEFNIERIIPIYEKLYEDTLKV